MIPSPSLYPQVSNQMYGPQDPNMISHQMQDLKLGPPLPPAPSSNILLNSQQSIPGSPSPQHNKASIPTTVTYSSQPRATYPYSNNNPPPPGNVNSSLQRPSINNNQYPANHPYPGQCAQQPKPGQHQPASSPRTYPTNNPRYSNGISNGCENGGPQSPNQHSGPQFPNQTIGPQSPNQHSGPQFPNQTIGPASPHHTQQQNYNSPAMPQQKPMQYQPQQMGPPGSALPLQQFPTSPMNQTPVLSNQPPTGPQMNPAQPLPTPGFNPYSPGSPPGSYPPHMGSPPSSGALPPGSPPQLSSVPPGSQSWGPPQFQGAGAPQFQGAGAPQFQGAGAPQFQGAGAPQFQGIGATNNYPYSTPGQGPQQQQPRKLDLDQMPSTVQVRDEDRKTRSGRYTTDVKGELPPLVTTDFVVQDRGMCSPRFIRSSLYCLPNNPDVLKQTALPFAVTISPLASLCEGEEEPPCCLYREEGPLRCKRCKAYICPFMTFMEGGRCFQCAFCKVVTEVPQDYFCFLDGRGERTDKYHRPELCLGSYEYMASKEYCRKDEMPNPPAYIFMIEVSSATFRNGLIPLLCENMKNVLHCLQSDERNNNSKLRVGFVTYNNVLHFYNMKKNLSHPHIMVLSDVHNAFVPLLEGFLVSLDEAEALVDSLMDHIPRLFINEPATEIILGPVIQVGLEALKNANCSGKLLIFHSTIPNAEAPGKLPHREGQKLLGTDKQKIALAPQTDFYSKLAQDCVAAGCAVDLFLFPNAFIDIPSLSPLCRHTGGQIYKYTYFQSHIDGDRFLEDLERNITTQTAFDAVLRIRTSAGISPVFYYGNFFMSTATDIELSAIDCHKSITVEFAYDDKLPENETVFLQAALLYTTCTGERRIRCHNLAIPTCVGMPDVFKCCELDTTVNFFAKQTLKQLLDHSPQQIKSTLINRAAKILSCYRKNCSSGSASGQLILPDSMKLFPLYISCLLRSDAIAGGPDISLDDRSFAMLAVNSMDVNSTATHFYPTLIPLHEIDPAAEGMPSPIRCSIEKLNDTGAYLLENGIYMFLWIGQGINPEWLQNVLGVQNTSLIDKQKTSLPELNTPLSKKIRQIIEDLEEGRQWYMKLSLMVQGDKLEIVFRQFLVEDRGTDGSLSYVDFLLQLHTEISKNT